MRVSRLWEGVIHLLYPRLCEACNKPLLQQEEVLCIRCESYLPFTDYHSITDNETALRLAGRFPFTQATSLAYFHEENILQHLLHRLKYKNRQRIGSYLGRHLARVLTASGWNIDAVIAVPLHKKKEARRGYNQSMLVADKISEELRIPSLCHTLERIIDTASQTNKSRQERIENVKDAFRINDAALLENKHVLLIDDVITTGSTIEACALEVLKIKGAKVSVATIAIAV